VTYGALLIKYRFVYRKRYTVNSDERSEERVNATLSLRKILFWINSGMEEKTPVYPIGIVARLLSVTPTTLRIWERKGLIKPQRIGKNRFYSQYELALLKYIKFLLQEKRINIAGVKDILGEKPCWEIKKCSGLEKETCPVYKEHKDKLDLK